MPEPAQTQALRTFAKVMRWTDPSIKLLASACSHWEGDFVERTQLLLEQAADYVDYLAIHWYVDISFRQIVFPAFVFCK